MSLEWIHESPSYWNADKERILGRAAPGSFSQDFSNLEPGELLAGDWWRVQRNGEVVGYGWMDVTWGDAEMLVAVDEHARGQGIGTAILDHLEEEARARGINYLYNVVDPNHPNRDELTDWLHRRSFMYSDDGRLVRAVVRSVRAAAAG